MSADWTTLAVAVLGVVGTLSSPLLGQRTAARAKEQEFNLQKQQRQEEREAERLEAGEPRAGGWPRRGGVRPTPQLLEFGAAKCYYSN